MGECEASLPRPQVCDQREDALRLGASEVVSFQRLGITAILTLVTPHETIPGKSIIAGATEGLDEQAGSLGALAAGAAGR